MRKREVPPPMFEKMPNQVDDPVRMRTPGISFEMLCQWCRVAKLPNARFNARPEPFGTAELICAYRSPKGTIIEKCDRFSLQHENYEQLRARAFNLFASAAEACFIEDHPTSTVEISPNTFPQPKRKSTSRFNLS